jgi:hypothetical protein
MNINKAVVKEYHDKALKEVANAPLHALSGISKDGAKALHDVLGVDTVKELANNKFIKWAIAITNLEEAES